MTSFSFDIVSDYDKAEMNNVYSGVEREISTRYDFKGTAAAIEWLENKAGFKIIGANQWQCDAILDIIRKKLAARGQTSKVLDLSKMPDESNLKTTWEIPFRQGLSQENAKTITRLIREKAPKAKPQIQGELVRVSSNSKDELQSIITFLNEEDFDFPLQFINYR
jgi:uncharacterized protein YajQ (UPF0234 family)